MRISKGLEQKWIAEQTGCTPGFIANVEVGRRAPSTPLLCKWLKVLGMVWMFRVEDSDGEAE